MSKNLSAIKKNQVSLRNNMRNRYYKSTIKTLIKKTLLAIDNTKSIDYLEISFSISQAYSKIDKAVKRGIISRNNAARKKSILSNRLKNIKIG